jgi:hypothetical protein
MLLTGPHPPRHSLAATGSYLHKGSFLLSVNSKLKVARLVLAVRCGLLTTVHSKSPICLTRPNEPADYTFRRGAFCHHCKDAMASPWHIFFECTGRQVTKERETLFGSLGSLALHLFKEFSKAASTHATPRNGFDLVANMIEEAIPTLEGLRSSQAPFWRGPLGKFLAFRLLTALPFHVAGIDTPRLPEGADTTTIKTIARAFEAVTLPMTLLRGSLTHWVDSASFHINRLFVAWTLDVPQDRSAWAPILDNTNAVVACAPTAFSAFTAAMNPTGMLTRSGLSAATRGGNPVRAPSGAPTSIPVA